MSETASDRTASSSAPATAAPSVPAELPEEDPRFRTMRRLVNALLLTLIIGVMAIVLALVWKIKETTLVGVSDRAADERIVAVEATAERIALTLRRDADGRQRVVVLDGRTFEPIGEIADPAAPR